MQKSPKEAFIVNIHMDKSKVNSVKKALAILELFTVNEPQLSVSEISERMDMPRPTISRLVNTLVGEGYLKRIPASRNYSLGMKVFHLSTVITNTMTQTKIAAPLLRDLRDKLGETVYLDVLDGCERLCVLSFEGIHLLRTVVPLGQRSYLYAGADAKVMLAYQPEDKLNDLISSIGLKSLTQNTITDPEALQRELIKIRQNGYAISAAECTPGSVAVSCPLLDQNNQVTSSISVSFPEVRLTQKLVDRCIKELRSIAILISKQMGVSEKMIELTWGDAC